jgi:hypothetical protein
MGKVRRKATLGERLRKATRKLSNATLPLSNDFDEKLASGMWRRRTEHRSIKWRLKRIWRSIRKVVKQ